MYKTHSETYKDRISLLLVNSTIYRINVTELEMFNIFIQFNNVRGVFIHTDNIKLFFITTIIYDLCFPRK